MYQHRRLEFVLAGREIEPDRLHRPVHEVAAVGPEGHVLAVTPKLETLVGRDVDQRLDRFLDRELQPETKHARLGRRLVRMPDPRRLCAG